MPSRAKPKSVKVYCVCCKSHTKLIYEREHKQTHDATRPRRQFTSAPHQPI